MKNITSIEYTDAMITSSTLAEPGPGEVEWVSGTSYAKGFTVIRAALHRKFTRTIAGGGTTAPELDAVNWEDTGATNKMAMFDLTSNQQSVATGPQTIVLNLGKRFNSIGVTGLQASKVRFVLTVGATVYWDKEIKTSLRRSTSWTEYLLGQFRYLEAIARFDVPPVSGATLTITLTGNTVKVGRWFIGTAVDMGKAELDSDGDALDLSEIIRDDFGNARIHGLPLIPRPSISLVAESVMVDKLRNLRRDTAGKVTLWSGLDDKITSPYFNLFLVAGKATRFRFRPINGKKVRVSIELEEI